MLRYLLLYSVYLSLVFAPLARAQVTPAYDLFIAKVTGFSSSTVAFSTTGAPLVSSGTPSFAAQAPTFSGGGSAITTNATVAVNSAKVAVVVKGASSGAQIFAAARLLAMGGGGVAGLTLTALTMVPMIETYFNSAGSNVSLGPLSVRETSEPFMKSVDVMHYSWTSPHGVTGFSSALDACRNSFSVENVPNMTVEVNGPDSATCMGNGGGLGQVNRVLTMGGKLVPASWADIAPYMDKPVDPATIKSLMDKGAIIEFDPKTVTGPATVDGPSKVEKVTKNGIETTTTTTPYVKPTYTTKIDPATGKTVPVVKVIPGIRTTVTEKNISTGVTTTTQTGDTTIPGETPTSGTPTTEGGTPAEPKEIETCGLPGKPACLIDEKDTPPEVAEDVYRPKLDDYKTKQGELKDKVAGDADKSFFLNWSSVFVTPPLAACTGYILPRDMGTIDPCPVVDGVRTIMAYIWALTALFLAVGMVKKVV